MNNSKHEWIEFLSGRNVIEVRNEKQFNIFKQFLESIGLADVLLGENTFSDWQVLAKINNKNENIFLFEYNNYKGLTWWDSVADAKEWYDKMPIQTEVLEEFLNSTKLKENEDNFEIKLDENETKNNENFELEIE